MCNSTKFVIFRKFLRLSGRLGVCCPWDVGRFLSSATFQIILVEMYLIGGLIRRYLEQKEDAARQRTQVVVLQMRPLFIRNTLMSVYYLCA